MSKGHHTNRTTTSISRCNLQNDNKPASDIDDGNCQHLSNMNRYHLYLVLLLGLTRISLGEIIELNDENFSNEIIKFDTALVVFHAPWCGQCKKLMKKLPEIDSKMKEFPKPVTIITINCEDEGKSTCDKYHIGGFPILKSFLKGNVYGKFEGSREVEEIVKFMKIESSEVAKRLADFRNLENILKQEDRVCVIAKLRDGSDLEAVFMKLAENLRRKISFLYVHTEEERQWIKLYRHPKLWNKFEDHFVEYSGEESASSIESFIVENYHGLVGVKAYSNSKEFKFPLVTAYYNIDFEKNAKLTNYWRNRILQVATKYKDKYNFAISSKEEFTGDLEDMGVQNTSKDKPIVVVVLETNEKFILTDNFSVETLDTFLHKIEQNSINPYLKSQKNPVKNDSFVVEAVGSTFYDIVIRNPNDTMVMVFAEWCGHCKRFEPTYKKLAKLMHDEYVTFVRIDGTENDVPVAYTPTGYPTIYWSTKDYRKSPILYQGDRTIEDIIKFIAKHATSELKNYDRDGNLKRVKTEL